MCASPSAHSDSSSGNGRLSSTGSDAGGLNNNNNNCNTKLGDILRSKCRDPFHNTDHDNNSILTFKVTMDFINNTTWKNSYTMRTEWRLWRIWSVKGVYHLVLDLIQLPILPTSRTSCG